MNFPVSCSLSRSTLRRASDSPLVYAIAFLGLFLLAIEIARPCFFLNDDNANWFIAAYVHDFRVLSESGRVAEVNYFQHAGEPFIEEGQTAVLYPLIYPGVALAKWVSGDVRWSLEWIAAEHLLIGLLGFYFWARQIGSDPWLAALGGLAWVLNPFVLIISASWIMLTYVAAWLPWLFWALDRLWRHPSLRSAFYLGGISSLFFLQGYVQLSTYAMIFLGLYALFVFALEARARKWSVVYWLGISALIFTILVLPLILPMWAAAAASPYRAGPMSMEEALYYSLGWDSIFNAQFFSFTVCVFGASSAILFCPALGLLPLSLYLLWRENSQTRRRLFAMLVLGILAMAFSTRAHQVFSHIPLTDRFRWPFKVFVFADFFFLAALVVGLSSWAKDRWILWGKTGQVAWGVLGLVAMANLSVALSHHDSDLLSHWTLPANSNPILPTMDPQVGRVATFGNDLPKSLDNSYLTQTYATYHAFPSLGGYNVLVNGELVSYALYLDYPNMCGGVITRDFQKDFELRSVRYWIVDPHSTQFQDIQKLPNFKELELTPDRAVYEDTQAAPLVYATAAPTTPLAMKYQGNSMLVSLKDVTSPVEVSVGPDDGWWYRIDNGPWVKPVYEDLRLKIPFTAPAQLLEITYFDPLFRTGLGWSSGLLVALVAWLAFARFYLKWNPGM